MGRKNFLNKNSGPSSFLRWEPMIYTSSRFFGLLIFASASAAQKKLLILKVVKGSIKIPPTLANMKLLINEILKKDFTSCSHPRWIGWNRFLFEGIRSCCCCCCCVGGRTNVRWRHARGRVGRQRGVVNFVDGFLCR